MERNKIMCLLEAQGYPTFMMEKTADKVENFSPQLKEAFENWVEYGEEPTLEMEGYSYHILIEKFKMNPIGAFVTLDWIHREPELAVKSLKRGIK